MKLDLSEHVDDAEVYEHFELFKEAYAYAERFDHDAADRWEEELEWFHANAPGFLVVVDRWVLNHLKAKEVT